MDLTDFSKDDFDSKEWINDIFKQADTRESRDVKLYATSIVMRLQLAIQDVNNSLEEAGSKVLSTLPRVSRDIEALSQEATILKSQMTNVKQDIEKVEHNTAASMQTLVEVDKVKCNLEASSQALKEADNWTTLSQDIEEVMDNGDIESISSKLLSLQTCLAILTHVPDFEERSAHLEGLKVRLEALASPHLVAAFTHHNLEESTKYARMLIALGRSKNLEGYYHRCELQQLANTWRASVETNSMSAAPVYLSTLFDKLSLLITNQVKWCSVVFEKSDSCLLLSELCLSCLNSLNPPISEVISTAIKHQDNPLLFLESVLGQCESFLRDYQRILAGKNDTDQLVEIHQNVTLSLFLPVKDQIKYYKDYEESYLLSHLINADLVKKDIFESLNNLRDYCNKLKLNADDAIQRCLQVSKGYAFPSLISAIASYIHTFHERLRNVSRQVQQQDISIQEDWTVFNTCLNLIQTSGELIMAVDSIEQSLVLTITNFCAKIVWEDESNPFFVAPNVLLSENQSKDLRELINNVIEEDCHLLPSLVTLCSSMCQHSVEVALDTIMAPVADQLQLVPSLSCWDSYRGETSNLSVGFSPQEYITQVGQFVMTLPQHLEHLLFAHSPALNRAMQENAHQSDREDRARIVSESEISAADFLIGSVGHSTCKLYTDVILRIPQISSNMITQLTTDIDYICTILEDLGVTNCTPLDKLNVLLKTPAQDYGVVAPGNPPRIVAAVRQMRNIPVKS